MLFDGGPTTERERDAGHGVRVRTVELILHRDAVGSRSGKPAGSLRGESILSWRRHPHLRSSMVRRPR